MLKLKGLPLMIDKYIPPSRKKFGEKLSRLMEEMGVKATFLAKCTGKSRQAVSDWRHGNSMPGWETIEILADALRVPTSALSTKEPRLRICDLCLLYRLYLHIAKELRLINLTLDTGVVLW